MRSDSFVVAFSTGGFTGWEARLPGTSYYGRGATIIEAFNALMSEMLIAGLDQMARDHATSPAEHVTR